MSYRITILGWVLVSACLAGPVAAQQETDVFLAPVLRTAPNPELGKAENITPRAGYDNQPQFLNDGSGLLYASGRGAGTDIFLYRLSDRHTRQLTDTPESEYSPTPLRDGSGFSVVRVEADSTQRLWTFPMDGGGPTLLLSDVQPVGYHAWGSDQVVVLFILGSPARLEAVQVASGSRHTVAERIGRSIQKIPLQRAVSYVQTGDSSWTIERYDLPTGEVETVVETLGNGDHHAWMPDGTTLLMARESVIYAWEPAGRAWTSIGDYSSLGVRGISRIAVSPKGDWLAFVAER